MLARPRRILPVAACMLAVGLLASLTGASSAAAAPSQRGTAKGAAHVVARIETKVDAINQLLDVPSTPADGGIPARVDAIEVDLAADMAALTELQQRDLSSLDRPTLVHMYTLIVDVNNNLIDVTFILVEEGSISIGQMFEMQMLMTQLSQMSEMSTAVVDAANDAIEALARDPKGA